MSSRSFGTKRSRRDHLLRGAGVGGEVLDLRKDVEAAFESLEGEVDGLSGGRLGRRHPGRPADQRGAAHLRLGRVRCGEHAGHRD